MNDNIVFISPDFDSVHFEKIAENKKDYSTNPFKNNKQVTLIWIEPKK